MMNQEAQQALKEQTLVLREQLQQSADQNRILLHQMDDFTKARGQDIGAQSKAAGLEEKTKKDQADIAAKQQSLQLSAQRLKMLQENAANAKTDKDRTFWATQADRETKNYLSAQRALTGASNSLNPDQGQIDTLKGDVAKARPKDSGPRNEDAPPTQSPAQEPAKITSEGDYQKLAPGTVFVGPDGKKYKKPALPAGAM